MIAGTLEVQMLANMARLSDDMQKAKSVVGGAMRGIEGAVASAKAALGALGIGLGVGYFVTLIKGSIDAADRLRDLSKSTNITVEDLAGLRLLAKQTGTDLDGLAKGINKMSVEMGKNPEAFKALGITAKDNVGAFKQLADLFNTLPDIQQRNALAQKVFSKSWAEMAPALSEGGKSIGEIIERGAKLSGITKEMTEQADQFNDQMVELNTTLEGSRNRALAPLLPEFNKVALAMGQAAKEGGLLLAVWVGMGGAMQTLAMEVRKLLGLPMTEIAALEQDSKKITDYLAGLSTSVNPGVRERYADQLRVVTARLELLRQEKKMADEAAKANPPTVPGVDPKAAAAAAARAKAYLDEGKEAKDLDSTYRGLLKTLKEKLLTDQELTEVAKLQLALDALSAKNRATISPEEEAELKRLAAKVDLMKREKEAMENNAKNEDALTKMRKEGAAVEAAAASKRGEALIAGYDHAKQIEFETTLIGLSNDAREVAIALRAIETSGIKKTDEAYADLAGRMKTAILSRNAAEEGKRQQVGMWQSIESAGHQAFLSIFDTSKSVLERIRDMLKTHLLDILYQITVKKWIINLATSVSGASVAQSAFGAAGTMGSAGGIMDSFGLVRGLSTIFSGSTAMGASTAALSTLGTEGIATYAAMEAAGATAATFASTALSALPYIGVAVAAASLLGLFDSNDEPPPGYRRENTLQLVGGPGNFQISGSEIPDPNNQNYTPFVAALNDPSKFDPAVLARLVGTQVSVAAGHGSAELVASLTQALGPAAQAAAAATAAIEAHTAKINEWKLAMKVAADPLLYWTSEVTRLDKALKTSADSTGEWQVAFTAALKKPMDETQLARWEKLSIAIAERTKIDEAAAQKALQLAQTKVQMEIQLLEAQGKSVEALAVRRRLELAALDATLRPLQEQINAAEDLAAMRAQETVAAQAAAALAAERRGLELRLLDAQGNAAGALAARREDELAATNDLNRELLRQIYAAEDLATSTAAAAQAQRDAALVQRQLEQERASAVTSAAGVLRQAYQREAADLQQMADKWKGAAASLRAYGETLVGIGSGGMSYAAAARQFAATAASARLGDLGAIGNLQSASEQFRTASLSGSGSALAYARDVARIQAAVADTVALADRQESVALRQLDRLSAQVSALVDINDSVISVQAAITALNAAVAQLQAVSVDAARDARTTRETVQAVANGQLSFSTVAA